MLVTAIGFTSCKSESKDTTKKVDKTEQVATADASFGVRGNCGMCKTTIEKADSNVSGVVKATWDKDKKKIDVSFDDKKNNVLAVEKAIADSGYDTENVRSNLDAYENLPACCKYDHTMKMNQLDAPKTKDDH